MEILSGIFLGALLLGKRKKLTRKEKFALLASLNNKSLSPSGSTGPSGSVSPQSN